MLKLYLGENKKVKIGIKGKTPHSPLLLSSPLPSLTTTTTKGEGVMQGTKELCWEFRKKLKLCAVSELVLYES